MPITTILFDIGNVLTHDGYESYLVDPIDGLALPLHLPAADVIALTNDLFETYGIIPRADEAVFWQQVSDRIGIPLSPERIAATRLAVTRVNPEAIEVFELLQEKGIHIGIISNNIEFQYAHQLAALAFEDYADKDLVFLSHTAGVTKASGLFERAAGVVDPADTYVIDDRAANISYARKLGFHTSLYSLSSGQSLMKLVQEIIKL